MGGTSWSCSIRLDHKSGKRRNKGLACRAPISQRTFSRGPRPEELKSVPLLYLRSWFVASRKKTSFFWWRKLDGPKMLYELIGVVRIGCAASITMGCASSREDHLLTRALAGPSRAAFGGERVRRIPPLRPVSRLLYRVAPSAGPNPIEPSASVLLLTLPSPPQTRPRHGPDRTLPAGYRAQHRKLGHVSAHQTHLEAPGALHTGPPLRRTFRLRAHHPGGCQEDVGRRSAHAQVRGCEAGRWDAEGYSGLWGNTVDESAGKLVARFQALGGGN